MAKVAQQEVTWLEKVLRDNPNRWTVVCQHQPVYPIAKNRTYMATMQSMLVPLYDKYGVDLVLQGHDHSYGRTHVLRAGKVVPAGSGGTTYVVSVSGPKMYDLTVTDPSLMAKTLTATQLYQIVSVERDRLAYRAYSIDGATVDSFEIHKAAEAK
jgi:3',5'-cyclic AMP phosphodiesterase CpdA